MPRGIGYGPQEYPQERPQEMRRASMRRERKRYAPRDTIDDPVRQGGGGLRAALRRLFGGEDEGMEPGPDQGGFMRYDPNGSQVPDSPMLYQPDEEMGGEPERNGLIEMLRNLMFRDPEMEEAEEEVRYAPRTQARKR